MLQMSVSVKRNTSRKKENILLGTWKVTKEAFKEVGIGSLS